MRANWKAAAAAAVCVAAIAVAQSGSAAATGVQRAARGAQADTVKVANSMIGPLLVNHAGYTVFFFTKEKRDSDLCARIKDCMKDWPPVTTADAPLAGPGVNPALLGSIPYQGSLRQVTYAGHPLHTYRLDYGRASMMNIGNKQYGGKWYALTPSATVIK